MVQTALAWLQNNISNLWETLVYVAIGLVTLAGLFKCIYPVYRNGTLLNRAIIKLEKSTAQGKAPLWREPRFLGRSLREEWQRFLLNASQLDLRGISCNAQEYINEDSVVYKPGHSQLAELIPSLLTSLGILGTFMGMMQGLSTVNFSNAEGTIQSIPVLLQGMRFAFATSVAGIACSLTFNMTHRMVVGRAFKALDAFDEAFYDLAMPRPLEPDVQMLCLKQDDDAHAKQLAEGLGNQIAGALELAVGRAMHPLTLSMDNFIKGATREQVEGIKKVVSQFIQQLNASLDGQMTDLANTMHRVNQGQLQTQQNLQRSLTAAERLTLDAARIQEASQDIAERMRQLSESLLQEPRREAPGGPVDTALAAEMETLTATMERMTAAVSELADRMEGPRPLPSGPVPGQPYRGGATALWDEDVAPAWENPTLSPLPTQPPKRPGRSLGKPKAEPKRRSPGLEA